MYCLFFLFASFFLCEVSAEAEPIQRIVKDYFNSASVRRFRKDWEVHRKPIEHALMTALKETAGLPGMNVYINKFKENLASGYFHSDNHVRLILSNLDLGNEPRCLLPEVQLSLASNVLKVETTLSKMIIHADYTLVRNQSDIIYEQKDQDPLKSSPFLFDQVQTVGKVAISMESCILSGFIITMLNGQSVNLGYDHFKLYNCTYTVEIYRPGEDSPPVIAQYELDKEQGLGLTHLLMKPLITDELVPKLQAAMFSFINTSALFGKKLQEYRENQEVIFQTTAQDFTVLIRKLNSITVEKNRRAILMKDYTVYWDNGRLRSRHTIEYILGEEVTLTDMVLTGLDTMYSAHCGGPFKITTISIADEIRFSSLQVRGKLGIKSMLSDKFNFVVEINEMVVDLQMGELQKEEGRRGKGSKRDPAGFKTLEVTGLRRMVFMAGTPLFKSAESLVTGYLISEVPKLLRSHLSAIFSAATQKNKTPVDKQPDSTDSNSIFDDDSAKTDRTAESSLDRDYSSETNSKSESSFDDDDYVNAYTESEELDYRLLKGKRERDIFKKNKKRFKSAINRPRRRLRRYGSRKRVVDNQIRKK